MDKKFGSPWHVIVGKYFSYEITSEVCCIQLIDNMLLTWQIFCKRLRYTPI